MLYLRMSCVVYNGFTVLESPDSKSLFTLNLYSAFCRVPVTQMLYN